MRLVSRCSREAFMSARPRVEKQGREEEDMQSYFARLNLLGEVGHSPATNLEVLGLTSEDDVIGAASLLSEEFPDLDKQSRSWKTILLYGPPGVGKTFLAKTVAQKAKSRFCELNAEDVVEALSRDDEEAANNFFSGACESERIVFHINGIDRLFSTAIDDETDWSRRGKMRFLQQLQGLQNSSQDAIFIASSETPWLLRDDFLHCMDKPVHIGVPNAKYRAKILERLLSNILHALTSEDIENITTECDMYTCSDMQALTKDAGMEPIRIIRDATYFRKIWVHENGKRMEKMSPCRRGDDGAIESRYTEIDKRQLYVPRVSCLDFEIAMDKIRPSVSAETTSKHREFKRKQGS